MLEWMVTLAVILVVTGYGLYLAKKKEQKQ